LSASKRFAPMMGVILLAGCAHDQYTVGGSTVLVQPAENRALTSTPVLAGSIPGRVMPREVVCSEPSPDIARLVGESSKIEGNLAANIAAGITPEVALAYAHARSEAIANLGKRLATIQLLRDGTFRACEAYRNGAISDTIYALIVAHTERAMVALLSSELIAGENSTPAPSTQIGAPALGPEEARQMAQALGGIAAAETRVRDATANVGRLVPGALGTLDKLDLGALKPEQKGAIARLLAATRERSQLGDKLGEVVGRLEKAGAGVLPAVPDLARLQPGSRPRPVTVAAMVPHASAAAPTGPAATAEDVQIARIRALALTETAALVYPSMSGIEVACLNALDRPAGPRGPTELQNFCKMRIGKMIDFKEAQQTLILNGFGALAARMPFLGGDAAPGKGPAPAAPVHAGAAVAGRTK
jgi:hypothetical protein